MPSASDRFWLAIIFVFGTSGLLAFMPASFAEAFFGFIWHSLFIVTAICSLLFLTLHLFRVIFRI